MFLFAQDGSRVKFQKIQYHRKKALILPDDVMFHGKVSKQCEDNQKEDSSSTEPLPLLARNSKERKITTFLDMTLNPQESNCSNDFRTGAAESADYPRTLGKKSADIKVRTAEEQ